MAGREEEELGLHVLGPEDTELLRRRLDAAIQSVRADAGGTVQRSGWPDAWAWIMLVALVASGASLAFALFDQTPGMGAGTPLALISLVLAIIAVGLKSLKR